MSKRSRDFDSYDSYPSKRVALAEPMREITTTGLIPAIARSSRRYIPRASGSRRFFRKRRSMYPQKRGTYAKINRFSPELKSLDTINTYTPIRMGDTGVGQTFTWNGAATDIFTAFTGTNTGGWLIVCNAPPTGTQLQERIGRKIQIKSILVNAVWRLGSSIAEATIPVAIRTMVVWDKNPNGVLPLASDILQTVLHVGNSYAQPHSPNNLNNRDRFRVLYDYRSTLTPNGDSLKVIDKYIKCEGSTVFNGGSGAGIGSVSTGALYVLHVSDAAQNVPQTASNLPFVTHDIRVRYNDF